ncbi:histone acetyltransferase [Saccharomycopsis crataegensis]|uniref:Histone acetyltransferase n=1 Tax=Saccharomycopsis crataegensis TaxID=43959 RepID=A0AAV5QRA5_9ASCO|nr:histone acetyltransferase [Saccharomycopsis crataegensis]
MSYTNQIDLFVEKLGSDIDLSAKHQVLAELCDIIESFLGAKEYSYFLEKLIPMFIDLLTEVPISFYNSTYEHKIRSSILEIIQRLVLNDTFDQYKTIMLDTITTALRSENEENGVLCIKIITSIHKSYKNNLFDKVEEFIEIIYEIYSNSPQMVQQWFNENATEDASSTSHNPSSSPTEIGESEDFNSIPSDDDSKQELLHSLHSFKTLSECPITMVSLLSSYKQLVNKVLLDFIPRIIALLQLEVDIQRKERLEAEAKGNKYTSVSKRIKNRSLYGDFIISQVKATSFLAYIFIRDYSPEFFANFHDVIPDLVVRLLQDCPSELAAAKKELLHATRHILSTPYKTIFIPKLDLFFDESILLGDGLTCRETLRPLAYSTIADFVHNIRADLTSEQVWKAVSMFSKILQDDSLNANVTFMCAKLLLNLLERVVKLPKEEARKLFMIILESFCRRFAKLNHKYDYYMEQHRKYEARKVELESRQDDYIKANNSKMPKNDLLDEKVVILNDEKELDIDAIVANECSNIPKFEAVSCDEDINMTKNGHSDDDNVDGKEDQKLSIYHLEDDLPIQIFKKSSSDSLKDIKYLIRNLVNYLKPMVGHLKLTNIAPPATDQNQQAWDSVARGFSYEELLIFENLFRESILCIRFFQTDKAAVLQLNKMSEKSTFDIKYPNIPITATKDEKDLMESISLIFMRIDPVMFNEIMQDQFPLLVDQMNKNPALLHIPHFFLSNEMVSGNFMGILISYLKSRLHELGALDLMNAHILLRLFKLFLLSLNLYPAQNEEFLLPHLNELILQSLKYSTTANEPLIYFYFIRILFKSIGGGRFEKLYKEVMPLMQKLLESLNKLIESARSPQERDTCIELCLSIPVRLSKLVSMLHLLMRPLVLALNGSSELVTQGLRTLELCVDNLNANYFDPIIQPVIDDVMKALCKHLKPRPHLHVHSHTAVRILGKFGGRNRNFIKPSSDLQDQSMMTQSVEAVFDINGIKGQSFVSISSGVNAAINILEDPRLHSNSKLTIHYRANAFKYLSAVLMLFVDTSEVPQNYQSLIESAVDSLIKEEQMKIKPLSTETIIDKRKFNNQEQLFERLWKAIFYCSSINELKPNVHGLITNLCNHFTQLYITRSLIRRYKHERSFTVSDGEGKVYLDANIMFNVINYALSNNITEVKNAGIVAVKQICDACEIIFGSIENSLRFGLHSSLIAVFYHSCYDEMYYNKLGGVLGLKTMIDDTGIPITWFGKFQHELVRALFYVLRDTPDIMPALVTNTAKSLIIKIIGGCNKGATSVDELPYELISSLVYDLASPNSLVRKTSQLAIEILSDLSSVSKIDLISSCKTVLLHPIFAKPLRALPFLMQIGHIEAITYWLGLPHKEAEFNDEMQRLLLEVVNLVEAEDSMLTTTDRLIDYETREQLTELRVVCINLLTVALSKPEYTMTQPGLTRLRILAVFFKTLGASEKTIVDASHVGLKSALSQNSKLPRELLQSGLRPMLMNLSDYRKLSVSNLQTLARLLVVLVNYFKVEIGKKLLDHANSWAMPELLNQIAGFDLSNNKVIQILNSIFNIFHLLPPKAYIFIPDVLRCLEKVEINLRRVKGSSCREPIVKYLDEYPNEASEFFLQEFSSRKMQNIHTYFVLKCPELKKVTKNNVSKFFEALACENDFNTSITKFANLVDIVSVVVDDDLWTRSHKELFVNLFQAGQKIIGEFQNYPYNQQNHFQIFYSIDKLQEVLIKSFEVSKNDDLLFSLVDFLTIHKLTVNLQLVDFIAENIIKTKDIAVRQSFLSRCVKIAVDGNYKIPTKVYILKKICVPILLNEARVNSNLDLLYGDDTPEWLTLAHTNIWQSTDESIVGHTAGEIDSYRLELLQLTASLLKFSPAKIEPIRKDVIKFSWNLMKLDDTIPKYAAYLTNCYFINAYDTHVKITTHMFFALLRANNVDARYLVKQSLDLLADVIPERMKQNDEDKSWIKWPRRVIQENNFVVNNVFNVYKFMVEHEELFFEARNQFLSNAINSMGKLTISPNPSTDNQILAIELSELILKWEQRADKLRKEKLSAPNFKDEDEEMKDVGVKEFADKKNYDEKLAASLEYRIPTGQKEAFVTFLIRYLCISTSRCSSTDLGRRALSVLYDSTQLWSEINIPLVIFERFLLTNDLNSGNFSILGYCWNTLEVLGITLENKDSEWIINNLKALQRLLIKVIKTHNHDLQEVLQRVLRIILKAITEESYEDSEPEDVKNFMNLLISVISSDLGNTASLAAGITLFSTVTYYQPERLTPLIPSIIKTFGKLCKDHVTITMTQKISQENSTQVEEEARMTAKLLSKILDFATIRISYFGDHRRIFLSILAQFIERSYDKDLSKHIVDVVYKWIFSSVGAYPTHKEKAAILSKMMGYEPRREIPMSLSKDYLKIIIKIFEDKSPKTADLTSRLEHSFLLGTRFIDVGIRQRFMRILADSLQPDIKHRLYYVIKEQNWEDLGDFPWLMQALELMFGSFNQDAKIQLKPGSYKFAPLGYLDISEPSTTSAEPSNSKLKEFLDNHNEFIVNARSITAGDVIAPLVEILHNDINSIKMAWVDVFPVAYGSIPRKEKADFSTCFTSLLSKDYHLRASGSILNGVQALLEGACKCDDLHIPPHLSKYLSTAFNTYYSTIQDLESQSTTFNQAGGDESVDDALLEVYMSVEDKDMFYGLWRRRAKYALTNSALSFEQIGMCDMAMRYYENAQIKARTRALPYSESEYSLWEDNWISCAEKLQHWDILTELSKHENYTDLLLECGWRVANWNDDKEPLEQSVKTVIDVPTPRRQTFQTFLCLQDFAQQKKTMNDVLKLCDEGTQLALKKWASLPTRFTGAHVSMLHVFQQYVEFNEASQIYNSLVTTNSQNIEVKSQELKRVLQAWRERLPNVWDDINIWNDLIVWRQHFFQLVNNIYIPFLQAGKGNTYSQVYCGYHETACVINRFAHVARKHGLDEVCISQLNKIYNLPNIEIMEAFLKLIEQVKCYYQNDKELYTGLDVISNTNLAYFGTQQKAEFFVLKGMFLAKLNSQDKANHAFATAIQLDSNLAKAWAKWGLYNYKLFKQSNKSTDLNEVMDYAKSSLICFLHAVGLYKNSKSRRYLALILWIISLDDEKGTLASQYQNYKGEIPVWYWITYIPQLLTSLSHKEAKFVRNILILIAKSYPQALHFPLRTTKEDFLAIQKQIAQDSLIPLKNSGIKHDGSVNESDKTDDGGNAKSGGHGHPWEHVEDIMNISKTSYPLLALSLESLVAQITQRFKSSADEDAYRLVAALYNDGMQSFNRMLNVKGDGKLPNHMVVNLIKFAETVLTRQVRAEFEKDFIISKPSYETYIKRLIKWKDRFENKLDRRFNKINLESLCPHLTEFHHQKFEDIEIPGQYLLNKDNNTYFVKIERFLPTLEVVRGFNACYKRLQIRGKDGSIHQFAVQFPSNRHSRREERIFQLFRIFDGGLVRNVQCRSRNISLTLPVAVALSPHIRILSNDSSDITLQEVYEQVCREKKQKVEEPFFYITEKLKATFDPRLPKPDIISTMTEIFSAVQTLYVPSTIVHDYFVKSYPKFEDFWLFRRQFTSQYASFIFMTHMMSITSRQPQKIHINMNSGSVWTSEMLPNKTSQPNKKPPQSNGNGNNSSGSNSSVDDKEQKIPIFSNPEAVPFRLSPNIQKLIGPVGLEGILSVYVLVLARCLSNSEFDIENFLSLFVRDEVISWFAQNLQSSAQGPHLRDIVRVNVDLIITKIARVGHVSSNTPITTQFVNEMIASAVNPRSLAQLDYLWRPYL